MKIKRFDLIKFGHLSDLSLDFSAGPHQFHLVYGANESGKSTSMRALTSWLFGMPSRASESYVYASKDIRVGGILVDENGEELHCIRRRGRKATLRDRDDKEPIDEKLLTEMFGGVDQATFQTRFGISHDELLAGGRQILEGQGELGEILFSAGSGMGRLKETQERLNEDAGRLYRARGSSSVGDRIKRLQEMRRELTEVQVPPAEFADLCERRDRTGKQIDELRSTRRQLEQRRYQLEVAGKALPLVPKWRHATQTLGLVADAPVLAEDFAARRRQYEIDASIAAKKEIELAERRANLLRQLETLENDDSLLMHADEIDEIYRELPLREKAEADRVQREENYRRAERRMRERLRDIDASLAELKGHQSESSDEDRSTDPLGDVVQAMHLSDPQRLRIQRLASQSAKIEGLIEEARQDIIRLERRLESLQQDDSRESQSFERERLSRVLEELISPDQWSDRIDEQTVRVDSLYRQCVSDACQIELIDQSDDIDFRLSQLTELVLPDPEKIEAIVRSLESAESEIRLAESRLSETADRIADATRQRETLQKELQLPTMEELCQARATRDQLLKQCFVEVSEPNPSAKLPSVLSDLQSAIAESDKISDAIQTHHEVVNQQQTLQLQIDRLKCVAVEQTHQRDTVEQERQAQREHWESIWRECGLIAKSPTAMDRVVTQHAQLVRAYQELQTVRSERSQTEARVEESLKQLISAVEQAGAGDALPPLDPTDSLVLRLRQQHDVAVVLRGQLEKREQAQHDRLRERTQCQSDLQEARSTLDTRTAELGKWNAEWTDATSVLTQTIEDAVDATSDETASVRTPEETLPILDAISDLTGLKRERDLLGIRISSITKESQIYLDRAVRLLSKLDGSAVDDLPAASETLKRLQYVAPHIETAYQTLQTTRTNQEALRRLQTQQQQCDEEIANNRAECERLDVTQRQLCAEANSDEGESLADQERRAGQRAVASAQVIDLETQLTHFAGNQSLDEFLDALESQQPETLAGELRTIEQDGQHLEQQLSDLQQQLGKLDHQYQAIDGSEQAARLSQQIQFELGAISSDAERFIRLHLAADLMRQAITHYRDANQDPILKDAERFFRILTCEEYEALQVEYGDQGDPELQGIRRTGPVLASQMSTGTADALYLAMRLASLRYQMQTGKTMPLIVDDCLIQLDDTRTAAALKAFSELSTTTQIILFTHHHHLIDLANDTLSKDEYHPHELPSYVRA